MGNEDEPGVATKIRLERRQNDQDISLDRRKSDIDLIEHVEGGVHLVEVEPQQKAQPRRPQDD